MPDYGHNLEFGFFLDPGTGSPEQTLATGRLLDELGFDLIGIQDHPYQARHYDAMTLIASVLAQTERVRVFPDVANLPLRLPAMLALSTSLPIRCKKSFQTLRQWELTYSALSPTRVSGVNLHY